MISRKQKHLERLKFLYFFIFIVSVILVVPAHLFPHPFFMALRFPHYLEMMGPFLGVSWPMSFEIYHYGLYALALIGSLNILGIIFLKLRKTALFSSLIGIFLISLMILFFFFMFISVNAPTAVIYGLYSIVLLIVDWLTFKALIIEEKEA